MMVIRGELVPEQRVTQEGLARMLGVSTMPVREALLRLAAEGMVKTSANRSFSILGTTENDARSVFWVYGMLEGELAARRVRRATSGCSTASGRPWPTTGVQPPDRSASTTSGSSSAPCTRRQPSRR